jgi:predicted RNA-binding protein with PIN domain
MSLLIDGHNLIGSGQLRGIALADEDDELRLVRLLRRYRSRVASDITVIFDSGIPGGLARELSGGGVHVVFAHATKQRADDLIAARLRRSQRPRDMTVVTSDSQLAVLAQARGAHVLNADQFALRLQAPLHSASRRQRPERLLSDHEVDDWLRFFGERDSETD